jgi:16S rRNA G1207 methylase RsmC
MLIVGLWPSEELLAYYCIKNFSDQFRGVNVAELGAGVGLAGFILASNEKSRPRYTLLTDGNEIVVQSKHKFFNL